MKELSIVIPFRNEWPQVIFTCQSIMDSIGDALDYEIILVDNCSVRKQYVENNSLRQQIDQIIHACAASGSLSMYDLANKLESHIHALDVLGEGDVTRRFFMGTTPGHESGLIKSGLVKYIQFDDKPSHWCAKMVGVKAASADTFLFLDAHVLVQTGVITETARYYTSHYNNLHGSLHLPISDLCGSPGKCNVYGFKYDKPKGVFSYNWMSHRITDRVYKVPVMSTCGMMISREIFDKCCGWPEELGIYGGGEPYINGALAITGHDKNIFPYGVIRHYAGNAIKRPYCFNNDDKKRNQMIALYTIGGDEWLLNYMDTIDDKKRNEWVQDVKHMCADHRQALVKNATTTIEEWAAKEHETRPEFFRSYVT